MANTPNIVRAVGNQLGTTLNAGISSSASSITLVDATGFSTDGGYIIIDENITGKEEIVYVTGVAGSTLTVATDGRGRCGTSATSHDAGATVSDILVDEHINGIADRFIVEHNDDGTHTEDYATLTGTQELTNKTLTSPTISSPNLEGNIDGWVSVDESWSYASSTTIRVPSGAASKYRKGDRIKFTQTTVKYMVIVGVADTVLTVTGGDDYTVANAAITANYYSHASTPVGWPMYFNYDTVVTCPSGTAPTYADNQGKFWIEGNTVHYIIRLANTTGGTAGASANPLYISLPVAVSNTDVMGSGVWYEQDVGTLKFVLYRQGTTTTAYFHDANGANSTGADQSSVNRYLFGNLTYNY